MANNEAAPDPVVETGIATDLERENLQQKFERWEKALVLRWSEWQQEARLDFDFAAGRQWSEDEMLRIEDNGRIPVVFNLAAPTIDAVSGAEIQNRQIIIKKSPFTKQRTTRVGEFLEVQAA